jgi:hypothetical protein
MGFWDNRPAMAMEDPLHRGQANPRSWKLTAGMQSLEWSKQLVGIGHVETCPVVSYIELRPGLVPIASIAGAEFNARMRALATELDGIIEEVGQRDLKQMRIALRAQTGLNDKFRVPAGIGIPEPGDDGAGQRCHIHTREGELTARDTGQMQQIVDQMPHALRFRTDPVEILARPVVETGSVILYQRATPAINAAQWRPQIV